MKKNILYLTLASVILFTGCEENHLLRPFGDDDGVAPAPVSKVTVRNFPGGATLKYNLPLDDDLSYVAATFIGTNGEPRQLKASAYSDSLVINGLGDTKKYNVTLKAYDKFENASEAVVVSIKPLTPPIVSVFESLKTKIDFGGCLIDFENPEKAEIGIYVNVRDSITKEMEFFDVFFTEKESGRFAVRGLPPKETDFSVYVQDTWENRSSVLKFSGTPIPEEELDRKKVNVLSSSQVLGDLTDHDIIYPLHSLVNGRISDTDFYLSNSPLEFPHRFSFDLGVVVQLSRIKTFQLRSAEGMWQHGAWKKFKVYGCKELPKPETQKGDPLSGWTLMGEFTSVKPSGLPIGQMNDEDFELITNGEEWMFDQNLPAIRYIRFEVNAVHSNMKLSCMSEIRFWGNVLEEDVD